MTFLPLLAISEALICAHKIAKLGEDGYIVALLETALLHVGRRLVEEVRFERNSLSALRISRLAAEFDWIARCYRPKT